MKSVHASRRHLGVWKAVILVPLARWLDGCPIIRHELIQAESQYKKAGEMSRAVFTTAIEKQPTLPVFALLPKPVGTLASGGGVCPLPVQR